MADAFETAVAGHLAVSNKLADDTRWDLLAELGKVAEKDMRKKVKAFCDQLEARWEASWSSVLDDEQAGP